MLLSWNYASLRASRDGLSTFCERLSILPKLPGAKSAAGLTPHRGSPKIVRMEPRLLGIRSSQIDQTTAQNPHSPNSKFTLRAARRLLVRSPTPGVSDRIFYTGLLVSPRLFEHT